MTNDEFLKDLEVDVEDSRRAVELAAEELKEAIKWHDKMLRQHAENIIRLDDHKKKSDLI